MHCILINLDHQPERRKSVEESFRQNRTDSWTLSRMKAVDVEQVANSGVQGTLAPPEKGCFLSHMVAINHSRQLPGHTMILEDDALFCDRSIFAIENALEALSGKEWDILFTDLMVPHIASMLELYNLRRQLAPGEVRLIPLKTIVFAASTAYVVNANSKDRFFSLLSERRSLDLPYDLTLRQLVWEGRLNGFAAFPFPTSISAFADSSQIQTSDDGISDLVWNAFRRLTWLAGSATAATADLEKIPSAHFDPDCTVFAKVLSCMLSTNFVYR